MQSLADPAIASAPNDGERACGMEGQILVWMEAISSISAVHLGHLESDADGLQVSASDRQYRSSASTLWLCRVS